MPREVLLGNNIVDRKTILEGKKMSNARRKAINFVEKTPRCCVFLKMGYGKTRIVIEAVKRLMDYRKVKRVLIIAPKLVALDTWPAELVIMGISEDDINSFVGTLPMRELAMESEAPWNIINVDVVPWLLDYWKDIPLGTPFCTAEQNEGDQFDMVIIDESAKFKNPSTKRFKALKRHIDFASRVVIMSGMPITNSLLDIWSQIRLVDTGESLGTSFWKWRAKYFYESYMHQWKPFSGARRRILQKIAPLCFSEHDEDVVLPEEKHHYHSAVLGAAAAVAYQEMQKQFILQMGDKIITAANAAVVVGKLLQICSGSVYMEGESQYCHGGKLQRLRELLDSLEGNIIITYSYRFELRDLLQFLGDDAKRISAENVRAWNLGNVKYLLIHPQSAGHGLNLQFAGNKIVWYGHTWSLDAYKQTNARVTRRGQRQSTTEIWHIVTEGTVEETLIQKLELRNDTQEGFMMGLAKEILKKNDNRKAV